MDDQLRSDLDATRQHLQETADQMETLRADIRNKLRRRRWLHPVQERFHQLKPKRHSIRSSIIRRIRRRPAPPVGLYAR